MNTDPNLDTRIRSLETIWLRVVATLKDSASAFQRLTDDARQVVGGTSSNLISFDAIGGATPSHPMVEAIHRAVHEAVKAFLSEPQLVPAMFASEDYKHYRNRCARTTGTHWSDVQLRAYADYLLAEHGNGAGIRRALQGNATHLVGEFRLRTAPPKSTKHGTELVYRVSRDEYALKQGEVRIESSSAMHLQGTVNALRAFLSHAGLLDDDMTASLAQFSRRFDEIAGRVLVPPRVTNLGSLPNAIHVHERRTHLAFYLPPHIASALHLFVSEFAQQFRLDEAA